MDENKNNKKQKRRKAKTKTKTTKSKNNEKQKQKQKQQKAKTTKKKNKNKKEKINKNNEKQKQMENKKQEFNIQIIGEKIKSAIKRNAFKELIVLENKDVKSNLDSVHAIRKEFGHLINSIWLHDTFICIRVTQKDQISWCELIDRRTNKEIK